MSFADDFFGPKFVEELLKGNLLPEGVFRKGLFEFNMEEVETTLTLNGHALKTSAGETVTKALTASGSEYTLVESQDKVVKGKPCLVVDDLRNPDTGTCSLHGHFYNRAGMPNGKESTSNIVVFYEVGWDKLFIPHEVKATEKGEVTAIRGNIVRRKVASPIVS